MKWTMAWDDGDGRTRSVDDRVAMIKTRCLRPGTIAYAVSEKGLHAPKDLTGAEVDTLGLIAAQACADRDELLACIDMMGITP